ncbi:MAG TPA: AAA family ATPase, partial [Thermoanaerobaculia bacterium]
MAIEKIKVSNFKSFAELEVDLRPLNIVIGANAAGKSNFLEIFRFVRDVEEYGLENAVSLQGGMAYLANLKLDSSCPTFVEVSSRVLHKGWQLLLEASTEPPGFKVLLNQRLRSLSDFSIFDLDPKLPKKATPITGKADLEPDGSNLAIV